MSSVVVSTKATMLTKMAKVGSVVSLIAQMQSHVFSKNFSVLVAHLVLLTSTQMPITDPTDFPENLLPKIRCLMKF